jgi:hypothetical protein
MQASRQYRFLVALGLKQNAIVLSPPPSESQAPCDAESQGGAQAQEVVRV